MTVRAVPILLACAALAARPSHAQTVQYTSPAGVRYLAQADTGAIARAESLLAATPRDVGRIIELGIAQASVRQYREAIATYTRGLAIEPANALLFRYRGHRYLSVRQFDSALADLTRGNRLDTTNYDIWYHLGIVHFVKGHFGVAAEAFAHAQRMAPNDNELAGSTDWLWMALRRAGRAADAQAALSRITDTLRITTATAYLQRLKLYRGLIGPDQALTPADTADIAVATIAYGVGNWCLVNGDRTRAREWFRRSVASGGWPAFGFILSEVELRGR